MAAKPRKLYSGATMAQRVLDHARLMLKDDGAQPFTARDLLQVVDDAVVLVDASPVERLTAFAYLILTIKDEREAQDKPNWPETRHQARSALYVASVYAEQYERGSIINASV